VGGKCNYKQQTQTCYSGLCPIEDGDFLIYIDLRVEVEADRWSYVYTESFYDAISKVFNVRSLADYDDDDDDYCDDDGVCISSSVYHYHCYTYHHHPYYHHLHHHHHHYHHHQLKQHNVELLSDTNNYIGGTKLHFKLRLEAKDYAGIPTITVLSIINYLPIITYLSIIRLLSSIRCMAML
jgi:hypothetical protein